ncbi:winged helix-turn-helix domain-containing protein [Prosthecomicrobium hirschii]|uniref:winged helix-turn-helix domain-containing protein n=1 Tax=Prosthecodimorpha hirschii TaxID=665126 RepID=UPI00221F5CE8|nr:winged helix-turn-helix domain-containing protein [Prosthecomicrobium hirschii]MCW1842249.1 winged helix-turn-helix domain-containing protein [Prosthecomicrobium hirschii]
MSPVIIVACTRDHILKECITELCHDGGYTAIFTATALTAWSQYMSTRSDIAIFDLEFLAAKDFEILWHVSRFGRTIVMKGAGNLRSPFTYDALKECAFLEKPQTAKTLLATLNAISDMSADKGSKYIKGTTIRFGKYAYNTETRSILTVDRFVELTPLLADLIEFFLIHEGEIVSRKDISNAIYGSTKELNDRAIDLLVFRLRRHLAEHGIDDRYIRTVRGFGYRLAIDDREGTKNSDPDF